MPLPNKLLSFYTAQLAYAMACMVGMCRISFTDHPNVFSKRHLRSNQYP
jgi:hypothetical protein